MTPEELLDVFHRRIRLPDADAIPGWKQEHDGLVHRSYVEGVDGAGFTKEEPETLILGEVDRVLERPSALPSKLRLREADGAEDYHRIGVLTDTLWHNGPERIVERLAGEARMFPDRLSVFLVDDALKGPDGPAVSAAWIRFHPGTGFASLWGGGTLPEWRRQGIYSALLVHRARLAKDRGYEFLRVDASEDSRPILQKLGLHAVTTTTPYEWTP
jgi:GNAT superfamily N-acetyltransferase